MHLLCLKHRQTNQRSHFALICAKSYMKFFKCELLIATPDEVNTNHDSDYKDMKKSVNDPTKMKKQKKMCV